MKKILFFLFLLFSSFSFSADYVCLVKYPEICGYKDDPNSLGRAAMAQHCATNSRSCDHHQSYFGGMLNVEYFDNKANPSHDLSYRSYITFYYTVLSACTPPYVRNPFTHKCQLPCPGAGDANPDFYGQKTIVYGIFDPDSASQVCGADYCGYNTTGSTTCVNAGSQSFCIVKMGSSMGQMCGTRTAMGSNGEPGTVPPGDESHDPTNPGSPADCAEAGMSAGNVNGKTVCYKPAGSSSTVKETTTTGTSTNTSDSGGNSSGSNTEIQETKFTTIGSDGTATTTTETKTCVRDISGFVTCTDNKTTKTDTATNYCKTNPKDARCSSNPVNGTFGGTCSGGFTCSGDAVQCAIAKENHKRNCDLFENKTPLSDIGSIFATGKDPDANGMPWHESQVQTVDLGGKALDESRSLSGQCVRSVNVDVMGAFKSEVQRFKNLVSKLRY